VLDQQPKEEPNQTEVLNQKEELQEALKRSEEPRTFTPKDPVIRQTPAIVSPAKEPASEKVKDQFPEEVKQLLDNADLEPPTAESPQPTLSPKETVEIVPPIAPVIAPDSTVQRSVPSKAQPSNQPILRQWRDRLKQFVPLPEAEQPSESNPSILKGLSDRAKGLRSRSRQTAPTSPEEPRIIDIPATEDFQTPIAEPDLDQAPTLNVQIPKPAD
jgi:hypothetical protein